MKKIAPQFQQVTDGTSRTLRPVQKDALQWLENEWFNSDIFSITAPTGAGKSLLARTIQRATNGAIITNSNMLVNQYRDFYRANVFYGQDFYSSHGAYSASKIDACIPENWTVYNPISFRLAKKQADFVHPPTIIFDEAHSIISLLQELLTKSFIVDKNERYRLNLDSPANLVKWLKDEIAEIRIKLQDAKFKNAKKKTIKDLEGREAKLDDLIFVLDVEPETIAIWYEDKGTHRGIRHYLHVKPTFIPKSFLTNYFKDSKVILLSATILPADIREIAAGRPYKALEINSGIPSERRPFYVIPTELPLTFPINYRDLANKIDEVLTNIPLRPALVHVTYSDMEQVSKHMKTPHLFHDKETKQDVLDQWLAEGGVLLGGGMSEGLDLKGDLCRLNIVSKIQMPNIKDPYVQKRMHLPEGQTWLKLSALKQVVQSYGRSTRGPDDFSITVCLDKRVFGLVNDLKKETPEFFKEAIVPFSVSYGTILAKVEKLK